jgi:phosphoenolpyruvate synthase/pyruvate phosphate dikinase
VATGKVLSEHRHPSAGGGEITEPMVIRGLPASPGRRRGRARVLRAVADLAEVQPGEILVTRSAVPDVVVAFDRIGALITDQGGRLAHAAVVAREFGVPAVVGTQIATHNIPNGSIVMLDGAEGTVTVVDAARD